jgi:hypothetical protein
VSATNVVIRLASRTSLAVRPGGLIGLGYSSLSSPYLYDGSYIMEMGSAKRVHGIVYCIRFVVGSDLKPYP